jgi:hypothetical protein
VFSETIHDEACRVNYGMKTIVARPNASPSATASVLPSAILSQSTRLQRVQVIKGDVEGIRSP